VRRDVVSKKKKVKTEINQKYDELTEQYIQKSKAKIEFDGDRYGMYKIVGMILERFSK
jgi:hypothetical protein